MESKKDVEKGGPLLKNTWRAIRMTYRVYPLMLWGIALAFVVSALFTFGASGVRALFINDLVKLTGGSVWTSTLIGLLIAYIALLLLPDVLSRFRDYWIWILWFSLEQEFNRLVYKKKGELDIATHEDPAHNNLFNRINEGGVWRVANYVYRMFFIMQNILEMLIAGVILFNFKWWLLVVLVLALIPSLVVEMRYGHVSYGLDVETSQEKREYWMLQRHFYDLNDITEVKLMGLYPRFMRRINELFDIFRGQMRNAEKEKLIWGSITGVITQAAIVVAFAWGVNEVIKGRMQVGTLTFLFTTTMSLNQALSGLFLNFGTQYKDNMYVTEIFKLFDLKAQIINPQKAVILSTNTTPKIEFVNVGFSYPGASEPVLRNINTVIAPGEKMAIVGVNGAGKTTLIKLLCRFYDPTEGKILIDGRDLREIDIDSWYRMLGALFQDYSRYKFEVNEAIAVSQPDKGLDERDVVNAAMSAEANVFINEWEGKYKQRLGKQFEGGVEPSIGQWQKLALARTFYREPKVFILDEPTSSIDAEAEAKIFDKLEALPDDRTVILISHRFSTVRHAHKIIVIENGTISEEGSHKQLLLKDGTYARLFKLQAKGYK